MGPVLQMCEPKPPCGHIWKALYSEWALTASCPLSPHPSQFGWSGDLRGHEAQECFCQGNCLEFPKLPKLKELSLHKTPSFPTPTASARGSQTTLRADHS